jgi:hypothetical protein
VLALHEITVFTDAGHQVAPAAGLMSAALLHAETLAPEKLADQVFELAPGQQLKRRVTALTGNRGAIPAIPVSHPRRCRGSSNTAASPPCRRFFSSILPP